MTLPTEDRYVNPTQLKYAKGPFSYEFIEARQRYKWRIRDSQDNAVGGAVSEEAAQFIVDHLNATHT